MEKMARFPFYKKNIATLGKLIAQASLDAEVRLRLQKDPSWFLADIGLPEQTTKLINFKVIDQKSYPKAVALPYRLNSEKLRYADTAYLSNLSAMFSLN